MLSSAQVGRWIRLGIRIANRSWPAILFFAACQGGLALLLLLGVRLTRPPQDLLTPTEADAQTAAAPGAQELSPAVLDWAGRAWPWILILFVVMTLLGVWLYAGQLSYIHKWVHQEKAAISDFWKGANANFLALLGASGLTLALTFGLWMITLLGVVMVGMFAGLGPVWLVMILGAVLGLGLLGGLLWLLTRVWFWFIAIVVEHCGPLSGLKASFRFTAGKVLETLLLIALFMVTLTVIGQLVAILAGNLAGLDGFLGRALATIINLLGFAVNLYLGFAANAAFLAFYESQTFTTHTTQVEAPVSS